MTDTQIYATADDLIPESLDNGAEPFVLPSGKTVLIRGLSRAELLAGGRNTDDAGVIEIRNVRACLVQPRMTIEQIEKWQKRDLAKGDFMALTEKIRDLSGLAEGAGKSDVVGDGTGPA